MADAHDEMRTRGVANPLKYAGMLVPGRFS